MTSSNIIIDQSYEKTKSNLGLVAAATFGTLACGVLAICLPFVKPGFRKYCLPYLPASETQLNNLSEAFHLHAIKNGKFVDIGSGDGRICRLASSTNLFSEIHGVELNSVLVFISRALNINCSADKVRPRYYKKDLWKYPLHRYDNLCIFGVDSMMNPLKKKLGNEVHQQQIIFACRFPFENLEEIGKIGQDIDTVWIYKLKANLV